MNLAKPAIERPIWVAVSVVLIFLLGLLSIRGLPVQLFPDIDRPHLNITVDWRSASPQEMDRYSGYLRPRGGACRHVL